MPTPPRVLPVEDDREGRDVIDRVVFTPTLVKVFPEPRTWVVGDLTSPGIVGEILGTCIAESRWPCPHRLPGWRGEPAA